MWQRQSKICAFIIVFRQGWFFFFFFFCEVIFEERSLKLDCHFRKLDCLLQKGRCSKWTALVKLGLGEFLVFGCFSCVIVYFGLFKIPHAHFWSWVKFRFRAFIDWLYCTQSRFEVVVSFFYLHGLKFFSKIELGVQ